MSAKTAKTKRPKPPKPADGFHGPGKARLLNPYWTPNGLFKPLHEYSTKGITTQRNMVLRNAANQLLANKRAGRALNPRYRDIKKKHVELYLKAANAAERMSKETNHDKQYTIFEQELLPIQKEFPQAIKALPFQWRMRIREVWQKRMARDVTKPRTLGTVSPARRAIKQLVTGWTEGTYQDVQDQLRHGHCSAANKTMEQKFPYYWLEARKVYHGVAEYMQKYAPRAPQIPPGMFPGGQRPLLYRGIHGGKGQGGFDINQILENRKYVDSGFIAMSRSRGTAEGFAKSGLLMVLDPYSVPRGTPWIWYSNRPSKSKCGRRNTPLPDRTVAHSNNPDEQEVLLPPGELRFIGDPVQRGAYFEVRVAYVPNPTFLPKPRRRGAPADWNKYKLPNLF